MKDLKLIDGKFSPNEAKEILLNIISSKIQFHTIKDFSSEIRTGEPEYKSRQRINELQKTRDRILTIIEEAEKSNSMIELVSPIQISFSPKTSYQKI